MGVAARGAASHRTSEIGQQSTSWSLCSTPIPSATCRLCCAPSATSSVPGPWPIPASRRLRVHSATLSPRSARPQAPTTSPTDCSTTLTTSREPGISREPARLPTRLARSAHDCAARLSFNAPMQSRASSPAPASDDARALAQVLGRSRRSIEMNGPEFRVPRGQFGDDEVIRPVRPPQPWLKRPADRRAK